MGKQAFYQLGVLGARLTGFMLAQRDAARMLTHTGPAGAVPERDTLRDRVSW